MLMSDLDYHLPPELIGAHPAEPRDHSRLMVIHRSAGTVEHKHFFDLPEYLCRGDLLIVNDTRVIPAKLELRKPTGGVITGLFLAEQEPGLWQVMLRTRGKVRAGQELAAGDYRFVLERRIESEKGAWQVRIAPAAPAQAILAAIGHTPLPPYIERQRGKTQPPDAADSARYQTVYANSGQSLAAPTAGLHFTPELLGRIQAMGVKRAAVDLEVGLGTFLPVETATLEEHPMHAEDYTIPATTVATLREQRQTAGRIVVVGTTAVRSLEAGAETILDASIPAAAIRSTTRLKIAPGYAFQLTDILITNFHLPRSTLLALVAAMVGLDRLKELYALAIDGRYRFYSYGDAMLILP
jgi:S-adenosylmethionine:tRNA ribosyltransferase-isomerase